MYNQIIVIKKQNFLLLSIQFKLAKAIYTANESNKCLYGCLLLIVLWVGVTTLYHWK